MRIDTVSVAGRWTVDILHPEDKTVAFYLEDEAIEVTRFHCLASHHGWNHFLPLTDQTASIQVPESAPRLRGKTIRVVLNSGQWSHTAVVVEEIALLMDEGGPRHCLLRWEARPEEMMAGKRICANCKRDLGTGSGHFVPPSFGDLGSYICKTKEEAMRLFLEKNNLEHHVWTYEGHTFSLADLLELDRYDRSHE